MTGPSTKNLPCCCWYARFSRRAGAGSVPHHQHHVVAVDHFGLGGVAQQRL